MLDLKALLTKIVVGVDNPNASFSGLGAKTFLDTFYNTSYSSALANSYQFKSFMAAQYNHQYRSMPVSVYSSYVADNSINPSLGLYAYNLLMFEYNHTYSAAGNSYPWGIIYITGVLNHSHSSVTESIIGYQPSGSAYCVRENIKIQLNNPDDLMNPHFVASKVYNAKVVVPFVTNAMLAGWLTPYVTKTSESDVTLDMTAIRCKKSSDAENAFSAIIVYWS